MTVSVLMATYKEEEVFLRQAIESVLDQTFRDFELIIVLDNPENELHKKIICEYAAKDSRIRFLINEKNMGLPRSLNRGLKEAQGEFIARMDADDISYPYRFEKQMQYLKDNHYDLIGGLPVMIDKNGKVIYSIGKVPSDSRKIRKALQFGQVIAHPTWMGRRAVFTDLEGYRPIPLCEDYDFTLRASLKGYTISNLMEPVLRYRVTQNSLSRSSLYKQYLYMRFLTDAYKKGKAADMQEADRYVEVHNDPVSAGRYLKANGIFNDMLTDLTEKKYLPFIGKGFRLLFTSGQYLDKIYRFVRLHMYS